MSYVLAIKPSERNKKLAYLSYNAVLGRLLGIWHVLTWFHWQGNGIKMPVITEGAEGSFNEDTIIAKWMSLCLGSDIKEQEGLKTSCGPWDSLAHLPGLLLTSHVAQNTWTSWKSSIFTLSPRGTRNPFLLISQDWSPLWEILGKVFIKGKI